MQNRSNNLRTVLVAVALVAVAALAVRAVQREKAVQPVANGNVPAINAPAPTEAEKPFGQAIDERTYQHNLLALTITAPAPWHLIASKEGLGAERTHGRTDATIAVWDAEKNGGMVVLGENLSLSVAEIGRTYERLSSADGLQRYVKIGREAGCSGYGCVLARAYLVSQETGREYTVVMTDIDPQDATALSTINAEFRQIIQNIRTLE